MKISVIFFLLVTSLVPITTASAIAEEHEDDSINIHFLVKFFPEEVIGIYRPKLSLFRLPVCWRGATDEDYLKAICASLGIGMTGGRTAEIIPGDCKTLEDQHQVIRIIYEYLYKIQLYGFGLLIPSVIKEVESTSVLPGSAWLIKQWKQINNRKPRLTIKIPTE